MEGKNTEKSPRALAEERVLAFWKEKDIFAKTLTTAAPRGEFVFYEGPPTANAKPALHHLEARAFKDVIPRYKTMQGYHVRRKAGWDTHGLPVELQIEKKIGSTSKKDIETYGIAKFNRECKESVHTYIDEWKTFTERMGYWVDFERAYYTYDPAYMESLWNIFAKVHDRGLLYKDYRVVPWCPRCGTALSSHELAQGYQDDKDLSVYAKFKIVDTDNGYFIAWTTTPWTLPGNVALAVGSDITYVEAKVGEEVLVVAKDRLSLLPEGYEVIAEHKGSEMVGMQYESLYPYLAELDTGDEKMKNAYKVYAADFVTTSDGTGIVHTAVMYGQDDFELGTKVGLPKFHTVDDTGHFIKGTDFLDGRFVKDEAVAVDIIKDLAHRGLLFKKEKHEHSYPHCWRCKTPLIYYARDSWYIAMSKLRDELIAENETIHWEPDHTKEGRFGEWLREVKDWAISRERYWGTPMPVWTNAEGEKIVVDTIETIKKYGKRSSNTYFVMRHGQTDHNVKGIWSCDSTVPDPLTDEGVKQVKAAITTLKNKHIDLIVASPFPRTQETAQLIAEGLGLGAEAVLSDERFGEWKVGSEFDKKPMDDYFMVRNNHADRYHFKTVDGESYADVFRRSNEALYDLEKSYHGRNVLIISHGGTTRSLTLGAQGMTFKTMMASTRDFKNFDNAEVRELPFVPLPHNEDYELDLHRPYIDDVVLEKDGKEYRRVKEVLDVWFDSGSMPFAQDHYPFANKEWIDGAGYPADFISEAIDQTRGWFYTLLAVGVLMGRGTPYKNVICLGHLLDGQGKKMSKSVGNIVEPFEQMDKFGADAVRFWMYAVNAPGESKNYDEKSIIEINNKVFNLLGNVMSFYELYRDRKLEVNAKVGNHVLDKWITARLKELVDECTQRLDDYKILEPVRAIRDFIDDLSTWYLRRSRDRLKDGDVEAKQTLYYVLKTLAQVMAPFAPFTAENVWQELKIESDAESVHLSLWPSLKREFIDSEVRESMRKVREMCTLGNAERKKLNIPVRQPLKSILVNDLSLKLTDSSYIEIIKEELNIRQVLFGESTGGELKIVTIDRNITPELKLEGDYRELVRAVQDVRKEQGLSPRDIVILTISPEAKDLLDPFIDDFKKTVQATEVRFIKNDGKDITIADHTYSIQLAK